MAKRLKKGRKPLFSLDALMAQGLTKNEVKKLLREVRNMRDRERRLRMRSRREITGIDIDQMLSARLARM